MTKQEAKELRPGNMIREGKFYAVVRELEPEEEPRWLSMCCLINSLGAGSFFMKGHIFELGYDTTTWEKVQRIA